tara:strand:+ start:5197 stop:5733 length:537 start_codon:yes stop_codon:yes gene_type:complete
MARNFTLNFPATAFLPCSTTTGPNFVNHGIGGLSAAGRIGLAFDGSSTDETAVTGTFFMPAEYTGSGTLKIDIGFYTASGTSDTIAFNGGLEAITAGDALDMEANSSFPAAAFTGTASTATSPGTAGYLGVLTHTLSADFKDSVAAGDAVRLSILRDVSADGDSGDVYVACVSLYEET